MDNIVLFVFGIGCYFLFWFIGTAPKDNRFGLWRDPPPRLRVLLTRDASGSVSVGFVACQIAALPWVFSGSEPVQCDSATFCSLSCTEAGSWASRSCHWEAFSDADRSPLGRSVR
jgi:hypothetical protein